MNDNSITKTLTSAAAVFGVIAGIETCMPAQAAPVLYSGSDNNVSSLAQMVNSLAAAAAFDSVAGAISIVDFESALPPNVTITGGSTTNNSGCGALCGFNKLLRI